MWEGSSATLVAVARLLAFTLRARRKNTDTSVPILTTPAASESSVAESYPTLDRYHSYGIRPHLLPSTLHCES
ncbi:hypothetical protein C2E23DRAFT_813854 [Lenzites betulinus]|nr:hypothetical protein C2E23DRAFT_815099 [Lenzites betulinus]KAH9855571.1 hypothetical protein C2E23DRAFT_813854 [Lenzites betulinus]